MVVADIEPPKEELGELGELPAHLLEVWVAFSMLEQDETGGRRIWTSGVLALDEFGVAGREERLRWIGLWSAAAEAYAEVAEEARAKT